MGIVSKIKNLVGSFAKMGSCMKCGDTWDWKKSHDIRYSKDRAFFVLCEECWSAASFEEKKMYCFKRIDSWIAKGENTAEEVEEIKKQAVVAIMKEYDVAEAERKASDRWSFDSEKADASNGKPCPYCGKDVVITANRENWFITCITKNCEWESLYFKKEDFASLKEITREIIINRGKPGEGNAEIKPLDEPIERLPEPVVVPVVKKVEEKVEEPAKVEELRIEEPKVEEPVETPSVKLDIIKLPVVQPPIMPPIKPIEKDVAKK